MPRYQSRKDVYQTFEGKTADKVAQSRLIIHQKKLPRAKKLESLIISTQKASPRTEQPTREHIMKQIKRIVNAAKAGSRLRA